MLNIYLGKMDEAIYYPPVYFDNRYEDEWIMDKLSVEMIKDVDKSEVISSHLMIQIKCLMHPHVATIVQNGF